jgi:hypothetical protein
MSVDDEFPKSRKKARSARGSDLPTPAPSTPFTPHVTRPAEGEIMASTEPDVPTRESSGTSKSGGQDSCAKFPDIFEDIPDHARRDERERIEAANKQHERLYRAVRYILIHNFGLKDGVPVNPRDFAGSPNLTQNERARFAGVYGQILADNWTDPSLGRQFKVDGDLEVPGPDGKDDVILVSRRFVDATVSAVQEYAANTELFHKVFGFMRETGTDDSRTLRA